MIHDDGTVYTEERPWGKFEQFTHNEPSSVKLLHVKPGETLSLQYHYKRKEFWRVMEGDPIITKGEEQIQAGPGDEFHIAQEEHHRIAGGTRHAVLLEIAFGDFDEEDIVRIDDVYGRESPQ